MRILLTALFISLSSLAISHPLKATITSFVFLKETNTIEIQINFFQNDFEKQLSVVQKKNVKLDRTSKKKELQIFFFFFKEFNVELDGAYYPLEFKNYTVLDDPNNKIIQVFLKITNIKLSSSQSLSITNRLLFGVEEGQVNIVRVDQFNDKKCRNFQFSKLKPTTTYTLK